MTIYDISKYFKSLSTHKRIMILLSIPRTGPITDENKYSSIIKKIPDDSNFSFNMKKLIEYGLVEKISNRFVLTKKGKDTIELIEKLRKN